MSERKVLSKYYPPTFDPRQLERRVRKPKDAGPKVQTVRLMAPFSMRCTSCGEYIYKGRKFNARKETPEGERYLGVQVYRFYIRCTRCSAEITFKTDPKNNDYACERGAKRNVEPWRMNTEDETDEQRLERLEKEEEERNAMVELEAKTVDGKREMAVADALDEIRTRNARLERADRDGVDMALATVAEAEDEEEVRQKREDDEYVRRVFAAKRKYEGDDGKETLDELVEEIPTSMGPPPIPVSSATTAEARKRIRHERVRPTIPGLKKKESKSEHSASISSTMSITTGVTSTNVKALLVDYGSDTGSE